MEGDKRAFVHGLWESVAQNWIERADYLEDRGAAVTKTMLERAEIAPTDDVLALADGAGGMAFAAATVARSVTSSDVVPSLVAAAQRRASERGLTNVHARVVDLEDIDAHDASYDVAVCREGLMFAVDQRRAFGEVARVLRPGGRLVAAVWGAPAANPWLAVLMGAVSEVVGRQLPPPGMPGPFALSDAAELAALVDEAGLVNCEISRVAVPFRVASFEAWWDHTTALAGPVANIIKGLDSDATAALRSLLRERVAPFETVDGIEIPGEALVVSARKP